MALPGMLLKPLLKWNGREQLDELKLRMQEINYNNALASKEYLYERKKLIQTRKKDYFTGY